MDSDQMDKARVRKNKRRCAGGGCREEGCAGGFASAQDAVISFGSMSLEAMFGTVQLLSVAQVVKQHLSKFKSLGLTDQACREAHVSVSIFFFFASVPRWPSARLHCSPYPLLSVLRWLVNCFETNTNLRCCAIVAPPGEI